MFDLDAIQDSLQDNFPLEITHPVTGDGGWVLTVASKANATVQIKVAAILDRARKRRVTSPAQEEADVLALVCAHVLGWSGLVSGGQEVPYAPDTAAKILGGPKAYWIREQVLNAIGDPTKPFLS